jgi:hypothetical protein
MGLFLSIFTGLNDAEAKTESLQMHQIQLRHSDAMQERAKSLEKEGASGAMHALKTHEIEFELCFESRFEPACSQVVHDVIDLRDPVLKAAKLDLT